MAMIKTVFSTCKDFAVIRSHGVILRVNTENIKWVQAAGNSVEVHLKDASIILKTSLDEIQPQLNDGNFVRIHQLTIINADHIRELKYWVRGSFQVFLQDGTKLLLSKRYRINFFKYLHQSN
jgi:two-component system, LytTR family, response regulator